MASAQKAEIKIAETRAEIAEAMGIRREVFIQGQGVPENFDQDGLDNECKHVLLKIDGEPIATARLRPLGDGRMKIERMAVKESFRSKGYGRKILEFIEGYARGQGIKELVLSSRWHARGFYMRAGFIESGKPFNDGIGEKHIEMRKLIP
jgi:predicted GNAT family N-acyltransferase